MRRARSQAGFSVLELTIVVVVIFVVLGAAFTQWRGYNERQRLRYGVVQVATDIREAQERAKAERASYTVTFTVSAEAYVIQRAGGFRENTELPRGVTPTASATIIFSAFGKPVDGTGASTSYTLTVQNTRGNGTVTVTPAGGVSYRIP